MDSGILLYVTVVNHLKRANRKKSSDDAATDEDLGAFDFRDYVAWLDNVENDGQRDTVVGNCRQAPETIKAKKNRVTTRRQTRTLVRSFAEMMWSGPTT